MKVMSSLIAPRMSSMTGWTISGRHKSRMRTSRLDRLAMSDSKRDSTAITTDLTARMLSIAVTEVDMVGSWGTMTSYI